MRRSGQAPRSYRQRRAASSSPCRLWRVPTRRPFVRVAGVAGIRADSRPARRPRGARTGPRSLYLETTNRCDSKWQTCVRTFRSLEPPADLTLEQVRAIAEQFPLLERVVLHGIGEPLLNAEIFAIVAYLKSRAVTVLFNSDAISLTAGRALRLIESALHGRLQRQEQELLDQAEGLAHELGLALSASGLTTPLTSLQGGAPSQRPWAGCQRPWTLSYVTANGNVLPCCISPWVARDYPALILGNALAEPFADIWNGERYRRFRINFESASPPDPCRGCGLLWSI